MTSCPRPARAPVTLVVQHHAGASDGVLRSPLVLLAAVAQHTS